MIQRTDVYSQWEFIQNEDPNRHKIYPVKRVIYMQTDNASDVQSVDALLKDMDLNVYGDEIMYTAIEYKQWRIIDLLAKKGVPVRNPQKNDKRKRH